MKAKYLLLWLGAAMVTAGVWYGHAAWRAHQQLVTLHVRNVPLREVLRKIEGQTWTRICAQEDLDTRVTLNVDSKPLAQVLNRISEQAGARWLAVHAVYGSGGALKKLESSLRTDGKIETAGWTKIAPGPAALSLPSGTGSEPDNGGLAFLPPGIDTNSLPPGAVVATTQDVDVRAPVNGTGSADKPGFVQRQSGPMTVRVMRRGGADGGIEQEVWSPEELVLESSLSGRLGPASSEPVMPSAAAEVAKKVKGKSKTYYAMRKTRIGMGFGGMPGPFPGSRKIKFEKGGVPGMHHEGPDLNLDGDLETELQRQRYAELGRLTPAQRVQRARERQGMNQK